MFISLSRFPDPPKEYQRVLQDFSGGLNTRRIPTEIADNQCCVLQNMLWVNGALRSRKGTELLPVFGSDFTESHNTIGRNMYGEAWHGRYICASEYATGEIFAYDIEKQTTQWLYSAMYDGDPVSWGEKGCFFRFGEKLYYKNEKTYVEFTYREGEDMIVCSDVSAYVPIVQINTATSGSGDLYQPENRLSDSKEIWFNADPGYRVVEMECNGTSVVYDLGYVRLTSDTVDGQLLEVSELYVGAALMTQGKDYTVSLDHGEITFTSAPAAGLKITARIKVASHRYYLPSVYQNVTFQKVTVNGEEWTLHSGSGSPSTANKTYGIGSAGINGIQAHLFFGDNLGSYNDAAGNANMIHVVFSTDNSDVRAPIEECHVAAAYGASGVEQNCIVMAGYGRQPNAIFWSGNDANGPNPGYFPVDQYNLSGEYSDSITAFGRQQDKLVIFQKGRISSATYAFTEIDGRTHASLNIKTINDKIGCDLPETVQLVDNNLVWCNTKQGVMYLKDSTYAFETLVVGISGNVNKGNTDVLNIEQNTMRGLLEDVRSSDKDTVCSVDDGSRYWVFANGNAYVWDYSIRGYTSDTEKLSWFYVTGIEAVAWATSETGEVVGLRKYSRYNDDGYPLWLFRFGESFTDIDGAFPRVACPQIQTFGTYEYLKHAKKIVFCMSSENESRVDVAYLTDFGMYTDATPIDNLIEHELVYRPNAIRIRRPPGLQTRQFGVVLSDKEQTDITIMSIQIVYSYLGGFRGAGRGAQVN